MKRVHSLSKSIWRKGYELSKMIRKTYFTHTTPVVFLEYLPQKCWFLMSFSFNKKLSWLLPVKLVHSLLGNVLQKRVRTFENDQKNIRMFENDQKNINDFNRTPLILLLEFFSIKNNNFMNFFFYFQWKVYAHLQKIFDWTRYDSCKMIRKS